MIRMSLYPIIEDFQYSVLSRKIAVREFIVRSVTDKHRAFIDSFAEYLTDREYIWTTVPLEDEGEMMDRMFNEWLESEHYEHAFVMSEPDHPFHIGY